MFDWYFSSDLLITEFGYFGRVSLRGSWIFSRDGRGGQGKSAEGSVWDEQGFQVFWTWGKERSLHEAENREFAGAAFEVYWLGYSTSSEGIN